ncbi:MAG TPA: TIGR03000 domain-containing protein [Gemmataceae bacterium]|jgi:uncharacterized protein (TIGR03000 family)|nr:TIGR03000 domain-containing protein [Gemmataceae bacterium]
MIKLFHVVTLGLSGLLGLLIAAEPASAQMMASPSMMRMFGQSGMRFDQSVRNGPMTIPNQFGQTPMFPMQGSQYPMGASYSPSLTTSPGYGRNETANYEKKDKGPKKEAPHRTGSLRSAPPDAGVIKINVPDETARILLDGEVVTSAGPVRYFVTPELPKGKDFEYEVKVLWTKNGKAQSKDQKIKVEAGKIAEVDFTVKVTTADGTVRK